MDGSSEVCFYCSSAGRSYAPRSTFCLTVLERKESEVCQDLNKQGVLWTPPSNGLADTGC